MKSSSLSHWWLKTVTFLAAALAAASGAYWVLKWDNSTQQAPTPAAPLSSAPQADTQVVSRLLGGGPMANGADPSAAPAPSASQFKLLGVVTEGRQRGYALIAIDDQPAKPYRVGAPVGETLVLRSVAARSAALATDAQAPASVQLVLPELAPPQTTTPNR